MKTREKKQKKEDLPTAVAVIDQLMTPGTILKFPERPIQFNNSQQSAVKSLEVNICSTESQDKAILHRLHMGTRNS